MAIYSNYDEERNRNNDPQSLTFCRGGQPPLSNKGDDKMETTTIFLATDPDYYGQDCTQAEANEIAAEIQRQVRSEYGSEIEFEIATVGAPSQSSGPLVDEISEFIQNNWIDWI